MKTKIKLMLSLALILGVGFFAACSDDDDGGGSGADKDALAAAVEEANGLLTDTDEGTDFGDYLEGSQVDLAASVTLAAAVLADDDAAQTAVDNATVNMNAAIDAYEANFIAPINPTDLAAYWKFDEGTGTTVADASGNAFTGTFKTGHAYFGAGNPSWTTDRNGTANKALAFTGGGNIEVPYNVKLNPQMITLSLWMKQTVNDPIVNDQYMIAMNRWNGYKLNMQADPKAFFTASTAANGGYDRDNADPILDQGEWYHIVVTFGNGHTIFYVNGERVKDWDNTPGVLKDISANPINLTIGQDLPTDKYNSIDGDPFYVNWGGRFIGSMDEIRIYKTPLTRPQVVGLYNSEL
jgi:hypothetical protein